MSMTGLLKQISSDALSRINETPSLLELFLEIAPIDDEAPKIDNLYGLSSERVSLLREIFPNPEQAIGKWTLWDFTTLENWKAEYPEDFDNLKTAFYQIAREGRAAPTLDLGEGWHIISYIFTGISSTEILPFLVDETENNLKVNPILCGQPLDEEGSIRYLKETQVREIAEALSRFSEEVIRQSFEQKLGTQLNTYSRSFFWIEDSYEELLSLCFEVREFYSSAANRENAMLIGIG